MSPNSTLIVTTLTVSNLSKTCFDYGYNLNWTGQVTATCFRGFAGIHSLKRFDLSLQAQHEVFQQ